MLTTKEKQVLQLISRGYANKEIAAELNIPFATARGRVGAIMVKLNANSRAHAVAIALRRGLIQ